MLISTLHDSQGGSVVVLPDGGYGNRWARHHDELQRVTTDLLQQEPRRVDDVWLWDVRGLPVR